MMDSREASLSDKIATALAKHGTRRASTEFASELRCEKEALHRALRRGAAMGRYTRVHGGYRLSTDTWLDESFAVGPVLGMDDQNCIVHANEAAWDLFKQKPEKLIGKNITDLLHLDSAERGLEQLRQTGCSRPCQLRGGEKSSVTIEVLASRAERLVIRLNVDGPAPSPSAADASLTRVMEALQRIEARLEHYSLASPTLSDSISPLLEMSTNIQEGAPLCLVVEDNAINAMVICNILSSAGWSVIRAENGQRGLELFEQYKASVAAVVTDVHMPVLDGLGMAAALHERGSRAPIIALTADIGPDVEQRCLAAGFKAVLRKPVRPEPLLEAAVQHFASFAQPKRHITVGVIGSVLVYRHARRCLKHSSVRVVQLDHKTITENTEPVHALLLEVGGRRFDAIRVACQLRSSGLQGVPVLAVHSKEAALTFDTAALEEAGVAGVLSDLSGEEDKATLARACSIGTLDTTVLRHLFDSDDECRDVLCNFRKEIESELASAAVSGVDAEMLHRVIGSAGTVGAWYLVQLTQRARQDAHFHTEWIQRCRAELALLDQEIAVF